MRGCGGQKVVFLSLQLRIPQLSIPEARKDAAGESPMPSCLRLIGLSVVTDARRARSAHGIDPVLIARPPPSRRPPTLRRLGPGPHAPLSLVSVVTVACGYRGSSSSSLVLCLQRLHVRALHGSGLSTTALRGRRRWVLVFVPAAWRQQLRSRFGAGLGQQCLCRGPTLHRPRLTPIRPITDALLG